MCMQSSHIKQRLVENCGAKLRLLRQISSNNTMFFEFLVFFSEKMRVKRSFFTNFAAFLYLQ